MKKLTQSATAILSLFAAVGFAAPDDPGTAPTEAVAKWRDARFGMFVHWGPVSLKGTEIGWSRGAQVPLEEYDNLYQKFNPTLFNADEWVAVAKAAGMKYLIFTTKHHDGFCMWDTRQTDHNIMRSPFARDVTGELAAACKKAGLAFGTYYSTCDWHHPAFPKGSPGGRTDKPNPDLKAYDAYLQAQVTELLTRYGPLFALWFDVPQSYDRTYGIPMVRKVRALQPDLMINNRAYSIGGRGSGIGTQLPVGDFDTPEQRIGGFQLDRPWETCMTICRQWAWKPNDTMKSLDECLHTLLRVNGGDGNLLFNVGPMPDGRIEPRQVERLKEMGAWLARHGEAVYGTRGGPWKPTARIASTRKDNKVFLHILQRPASGPVVLPAPPQAVRSARMHNGPQAGLATSGGLLHITIPDGAWDKVATVIELTLDGPAMAVAPLEQSLGTVIRGTKASASAVFGNEPQYAADKAIDGDSATRWATPAGTSTCWLRLDFPAATTLAGVEIDEEFASPRSRVRRFELQVMDGGAWRTVHSGKALGAGFSAEFPPLTTTALRLHILDASDGPTLSAVRVIPAPKSD